VAAILKDEDSFVEEWVTYHRLLGVDHFYLYDNDPRQPLSDILARHLDYVTVRAWLIDHDDRRYPGRTKQIKAYTHCLEHDAANYAWVAFIDCDEFIALEEHRDLKAFLGEYEGCDSIALNWHVFGYNGYYEDPPGLVIESLTRRMKEPRAMTKSVSRPDAIASINSAHLCRLKAGRKLVDANKQPYGEELYPGKTRIARINHYQCRSFTNWMQKPERGESGTFAQDPANAWRFSQEGCLRQFVSQIALDKNEHIDTSMSRHVEPVKRYLSRLRSESEGRPRDAEGPRLDAKLKTQNATSKTIKTRLVQRESAMGSVGHSTRSAIIRSPRARAIQLLTQGLRYAPRLYSWLLTGQFSRATAIHFNRRRRNAIAHAKAASQAHDWPQAIWRWRRVVDDFGDRVPSAAFHAMGKAHQRQGDFDAAEAAVQQGRAKHPASIRLAVRYANIAMARRHWPEAVTRWRAILGELDASAPAEVYLQLSRAHGRQGNIEEAEEFLRRGRAIHPKNIRLATRYAKIAVARKNWPETVTRWQAILDELDGIAPAEVYLQISRAHDRQGNIEEAEEFLRRGRAKHHSNVSLLTEQLEFALARQDWCQVAESCHAALDVIEAEPDRVLDDRHLANVCNGLMETHDYDRVIAAVQHLKRREGESKLLLAIEGTAYLRSSRTETAHLHWTRYWQRARDDQKFARQGAPALASYNASSKNFFTTVTRTDDFIPDRADGRFCVYTALFGEYDDLRSPAYVPPGLKFICFSDRARDVSGWDVRVVDLELDSPAMKSRMLKILPYDHLKGYDCSLYIDANIVFLADPLVAYHRWLKDKPFVAWRHPDRSGVYEEIEAILRSLRHAPSALLDQHKYFGDQAVPEQTGLIEACFLWRDHRDGAVRELMEQWWELLARFGSHRDQPALGYLMWKTGIRPEILPDYLGTSGDNEFFRKLPHKQTVLELERAKVVQSGTENRARDIADGQGTHWRGESPVPASRRRLTWVCRDKSRSVASTVMRGHQLSEMARLRLTDAEVSYVDENHLGGQSDSVLILTKGFLKEASLDELASLKERGNIVCADYVDDPARDELHECLDGYIAASMTQFIHYSKRYADKLVHLITHHSDPRLNGIRGPEDYCNIGYFGEIANARYASELQGIIDFCLTDTMAIEASWIPKLRHCNMHYAVRKPRAIERFKPFLKGFTAAQCHSNIIVSNDESDARYYLGSDYPYILKDGTLNSVLEMIDYAKASFGGAEWRRGLEIMTSVRQRCAPAQIESEIRALLARSR